MLGLIALSENFTTGPWVLNYVCFMHIAVQLIVANLRKNIYGLKKRIFNINNDLIRVMYNCFEIVNVPMWISWANSLYTVNL